MIGYVAKDADGEIYLHNKKPSFDEKYRGWFGDGDMLNITYKYPEFDNLHYTDEPVKVEINIKRV